MRRIEREVLSPETSDGLRRLQTSVDAERGGVGFEPLKHWTGRRNSRHILAAYLILRRMAGPRERCMYCVDSQGSDIEHFWPKSSHSDRMYLWENLLIACTQCGRFKGHQFPRAEDGTPLLIDPSAEDPWEFLEFDPHTGNLNARYSLTSDSYSPKGENTVRVLHLDRREGMAAGYVKTYRRLNALFAGWVDQRVPRNYINQLREADDHGLLGWFLNGSGQKEPVIARFRKRHPTAWAECRHSL